MESGQDPGLYKVPKEKALVLIKVPPSAPEWRVIFISTCAETHQGRETASDLFNTDKDFIPLLDEKGGVSLVRRTAIRWIRVDKPEHFEWYYYEVRQGAPKVSIRCAFTDGEVLEGEVYSIGPVGEQRVQDIVNRQELFLHLATTAGLFLINLRHVTAILVREENNGSTGQDS